MFRIKVQPNVEANQTVDINDGNQPDIFSQCQLVLEQSELFIYTSAPQCLDILTHYEKDLFSVMFSFVSASSSAYAMSPQFIYHTCM